MPPTFIPGLPRRVLIECPSLSKAERTALEVYLQSQPEVVRVGPPLRRNPYTPETLGLMIHATHFILEFAGTVAAGCAVTVAQRLIDTWWKQWTRKRSRQSRTPKGRSRKTLVRQLSRKTKPSEVIQIIGDGNTITITKGPKEDTDA